MHEAELSPSCGGGPSDETCSPKDRYCSSCNIQFMSYNTCQVHKLYYCSSRHGHQKPSPPPQTHQLQADSPVDVETAPLVVHPTQPSSYSTAAAAAATNMLSSQTLFAAISTNPLILVPCSFVRGKGIVPNTGFLPADSGMQMNGAIPSLPPTSPHRLPSGNSRLQTAIRHPPPLRPRPPLAPPTHSHPAALLPGGGSTTTSATYIPKNKTTDDEELAENPDDAKSATAAPPGGSGADDKPLDLSIKKKRRGDETPPSEAADAVKKRISPPPSLTVESNPGKIAVPPPVPLSVDSSSSSSSSSSASSSASSSSLSTSAVLDEGVDNGSTASGQVAPQSVRCVPQPSPPPPLVPITDVVCSARLPLPASTSSAPLVKQGNNVCKDCNIVFYRYDNYIAHKLHYCASRRNLLRHMMPTPLGSLSPTGTDVAAAPVPSSPLLVSVERKRETAAPVTRTGSDAISTPYFRCTACGVKFSSPDTLQAHQTYYCPRRETTLQAPQHHLPQRRQSIIKRNRRHHESVSCPACKTTFPSTDALENHQCVVQWKCPYCDVICPTLTYAQHHLATHADVRTFCCTVCGYRGNTLRGMRTHVRVHFDSKNASSSASSQNAPSSSSSSSSASASSSTLVETFIACVTEDGTITPLAPADKGSLGERTEERGDIPTTSLRRLSGEDRLSTDSSASIQLPSPNVGDAGGTSPSVSSTTATFFEEEGVPDTSSLTANDTVFRCECCGFSSTFSENVIQHVTKQHGEVVTFIPEEISQRRGGADARPLEPDKEMSLRDGLELRLSTSDENDDEEITADDEGKIQHPQTSSSPIEKEEDNDEDADEKEGIDSLLPKHRNKLYGSSKEAESATKRRDTSVDDVADVKSPKVAKTTDTEVSFHYLSKFIAHRKFYCVTRMSPPVSQETPPVQ